MCKCNMCSNEIPEHEKVTFNHKYGYFSNHDGSTLELNLCSSCLDILTDELITRCKINPIREYECYSDDNFGWVAEDEPSIKQIIKLSLEEYYKAEFEV